MALYNLCLSFRCRFIYSFFAFGLLGRFFVPIALRFEVFWLGCDLLFFDYRTP
jgi:hypothetical protein